MMERDAVLAAIDGLIAARARGDKAEVARRLAPGATYEMNWAAAGDMPGFPAGRCDAVTALGQLIDIIDFRDQQRLDAIVEGGRAMVVQRVRAAAPGSDAAYDTMLCGIWEVDDAGRIVSLSEYGDTASYTGQLAA